MSDTILCQDCLRQVPCVPQRAGTSVAHTTVGHVRSNGSRCQYGAAPIGTWEFLLTPAETWDDDAAWDL